jgi:hypothetical protein
MSADELAKLRDEAGAEEVLVFAWAEGQPESAVRERVEASAARPALGDHEVAHCPHPGGPPLCWCRPPLPGLLVPWLRRRNIDAGRSILIGTHATHDKMAEALGLRSARRQAAG